MSVQSQAETVSQSTTRMIYRALSSVSGSVCGWKIKARERPHQGRAEPRRTPDGGGASDRTISRGTTSPSSAGMRKNSLLVYVPGDNGDRGDVEGSGIDAREREEHVGFFFFFLFCSSTLGGLIHSA